MNEKITNLGKNTDQVNEIQRQVFESLDKRVALVELGGGNEVKSIEGLAFRMVNSEIKVEKMLTQIEGFQVRQEKIRVQTEQNDLDQKEMRTDYTKFVE